jgi:DNA polymerase elongation subunit (family B)
MNIYLDIETIPSQSPAVHDAIAETITVPGNISKAETIAAWVADKKPALVKEAVAKTSFDGAYGHICCIGWAIDDEPAQTIWMEDVRDEKPILSGFLASLEALVPQYQHPTIIGHNVIGFDIRFIWQRAIILGVPMPAWFPRDPKPWAGEVFDTMTAFAGARGMIGMDRLCGAMGFDGKGEIDGSMIADLWAAKKFETITAYCAADVERTRQIHRRMQVAFGEAA